MLLKVYSKHGEKKPVWLKQFKIALIQEDSDTLSQLLESMPQFQNLQETEEASYLLVQASELMNRLKNETAMTMKQLKKNIDYMKSTETSQNNKLDISH